ncbi:MAG: transposase [Planctomycetaceae bacterium]|nr:transposase [Planctomycetaceae bacterium]MCB9951475.1 transposase [Planctomycetaceae bacterium]
MEFHPRKSLVVENSGGRLSSDAGLLLLREFDNKVGMTEQFAATRQEQRLFTVCSYQANTWDRSRTGVIKAECHAAGTNRRAVVTNRLGATILPQGVSERQSCLKVFTMSTCSAAKVRIETRN